MPISCNPNPPVRFGRLYIDQESFRKTNPESAESTIRNYQEAVQNNRPLIETLEHYRTHLKVYALEDGCVAGEIISTEPIPSHEGDRFVTLPPTKDDEAPLTGIVLSDWMPTTPAEKPSVTLPGLFSEAVRETMSLWRRKWAGL